MIECDLNGHHYATEKLYFVDMKKLGAIVEEKFYPILAVLTMVKDGKDLNGKLTEQIYAAVKETVNRDDKE